jgi:hypothetical protein
MTSYKLQITKAVCSSATPRLRVTPSSIPHSAIRIPQYPQSQILNPESQIASRKALILVATWEPEYDETVAH